MDTKDTLHKIPRKDGKKLAYRQYNGSKTGPTLVFLGGYHSDMKGNKASFLDQFCHKNGFSLLRFDYSGHGESEGIFQEGCIGEWLEDALTVIHHAVSGDMILIGSSMGGWIGLLAAQSLGQRVKGFIGIAAAPDFTDWVWNHYMSLEQQELCARQGYITTPDGDIMTLKLFEEGARHLILDKPLHLPFPITLLHGKRDADVPFQIAEKLAAHITPTPAQHILIEDGDHRLAREQDLMLLDKAIFSMLSAISCPPANPQS